MKLALHRSLTFWSGILMMAFICFGWFSSYFYGSWLGWDCFSAENTNGGIQLDSAFSRSGLSRGGAWKTTFNDSFKDSLMIMPFVLKGTMDQAPEAKKPVSGTFRGELELMMSQRDARAWLAYFPHWLFLLAFAIPWTSLLLWRARRRNRVIGV